MVENSRNYSHWAWPMIKIPKHARRFQNLQRTYMYVRTQTRIGFLLAFIFFFRVVALKQQALEHPAYFPRLCRRGQWICGVCDWASLALSRVSCFLPLRPPARWTLVRRGDKKDSKTGFWSSLQIHNRKAAGEKPKGGRWKTERRQWIPKGGIIYWSKGGNDQKAADKIIERLQLKVTALYGSNCDYLWRLKLTTL